MIEIENNKESEGEVERKGKNRKKRRVIELREME